MAGIQMALGEGARFATICQANSTGCTSPTPTQVKAKIDATLYGTSPDGTFNAPVPATGTSGTTKYYDLTVNYSQPTSLLFVPGPTIALGRSKRVWIAAN
jgi:hypothetical protein